VSALEILRIAGIATVQDGGRPGHMHEGVPPGGPLVPEHFWAANAAVGNPPDAPVVELVLGKMTVSTPLANVASILFASTPSGSRNERTKEP